MIFQKKKNNIALFSLQQTTGRGRIKRKWISKKGDLTCSFLIHKDLKIKEIGKINLWFSQILLSLLKKSSQNKNLKLSGQMTFIFMTKNLREL